MKALIIEAMRESYGKENVATMTVGELRHFLEDFEDDLPVILSHDRGYTYGGLRDYLFEELEDEEEEFEEE